MSDLYAKIVNGEIVAYPYGFDELRRDNPNVSFPRVVNTRIMRRFNAHPIEKLPKPDFNKLTEKLVSDAAPTIDRTHYITKAQATDEETGVVDESRVGQPIHTCSIGYTVQRLSADQAAENIRAHRDRRLADTDWIVAVSYERGELVPQVWADYRQALRDVPDQAGFPYAVEWPKKPE